MKRLAEDRPVLLFFVLAFSLSWAFWLLAAGARLSTHSPAGRLLELAGNFGPFVAALILTSARQGAPGLRSLLARLSPRSVPARWFLGALLGPFLLMALAIAASLAIGGPAVTRPAPAGLLLMVSLFARSLLLSGGLNEETGWRGAALPALLERTGSLRASIVLGVLWGLWHAPLYFLQGTGQNDMVGAGGSFPVLFALFIAWTIGLSIVFTWFHQMTRGSLLIAILLHAAINTAAGLPFLLGVQNSAASLLYPALTWVVALIISRTRPFSRPTVLVEEPSISG